MLGKSRQCRICGAVLLETAEYFPAVTRARKNGAVWRGFRTECKACTTKERSARRASDADFRRRLNEATKRSYTKHHTARRAAGKVYRTKLLSGEGRNDALEKRRSQHRRRAANDLWKLHRRKILRNAERARLSDPIKRAKHNAKRVEWCLANPDVVARHLASTLKWQTKHPEKVRARRHRRRAKLREAAGRFTETDVLNQNLKQSGKCFWCSRDLGNGFHVDHLVPLARGGTNWPDNIVLSCPSCNCRKGAKLPDEFRAFLSRTST